MRLFVSQFLTPIPVPFSRHPLGRVRSLNQRRQIMAQSISSRSLQDQGRDFHQPSPVINRLSESKTVALTDLAQSMKDRGDDVISLAAGEPDFPTPGPICTAGIKAIETGFTKYTKLIGIDELRNAICTKLKNENGVEYSNDCIVVSNGAKQSVWQAIAATCGPGDEVIIPAPYWVSYPQMAAIIGAEAKIIPCSISDNFLLTPDALEQSITSKSRLLVLCYPSNPTGAVYTKNQLEAIAEVVLRHPQLLVLTDEIYEYLTYPPFEHISFASIPGMFERTLTINGFSKGFAMTGWRLGYLAASPIFAKACATLQSHLTSAPCSISQKAGVAALQMGYKGGKEVAKMVQAYLNRRDFVIDRLSRIPGVKTITPQGAFYAFPDVSSFISPSCSVDGYGVIDSTEKLCMFLIEEAKVVMIPGDAFGAPGHLRISYATSMEKLSVAMDRLQSAFTMIKTS